ncbi:ExbD/TolR family protein [Melittangium boletus]|uniref:Biopolymer transporter ExbD n=1 Tax=Melittangium boletus DSM 14713 TaxID=1294270 RepID=A0A250IJZ1_9BACT|nr:biopolymer transporter ExbD [Melittangium boletus]ATB31530.1 biopolymer transporter ExbD [Melittangium boletus DSM 14713]
MGMSTGGSQGGPKSEINVTPLVDVVLVLLIIFMVVTPMLQRGKSVTLPKAAKVEGEKESGKDPDPIILSVTADKKTYLEQDEYDAPSLEDKLKQELAYLPNKKILLKGDSTLSVGDVRQVMELTRKAKAKKIFLGVEEQKN